MNPYTLMRDGFIITLWAWGMFAIKHWIADYLLQTSWMVENKGRYFHLAGWTHALIHGTCSIPVWVILFWRHPLEIEPATCLGWIGMALVVEVILRHLNDFSEKNLIRVAHTRLFWPVIGLNQLLDGLIYVGLTGWWWNLIWSEMPSMKLQLAGLT